MLQARIGGVAHAGDAMCSHRPHRPALPIGAAAQEYVATALTLPDCAQLTARPMCGSRLRAAAAGPRTGARPVDGTGLFTATSSVPQGHSRRTTVIAGGLFNGRLYWDFASVKVMDD